jgi:hypothetical protein
MADRAASSARFALNLGQRTKSVFVQLATDRFCELDDLVLLRVIQYSTDTRYKPLAGAVAPAAARLRAVRMSGISSAFNVLLPIRINVPIRLRTM